MTNSVTGSQCEVSLPAERSFVVQFRRGSGARREGPWAGRVEHVVSGRAARFQDCAAMCDFIMSVLAPAAPGQPASGRAEEGPA